jgi:hypothetical protein
MNETTIARLGKITFFAGVLFVALGAAIGPLPVEQTVGNKVLAVLLIVSMTIALFSAAVGYIASLIRRPILGVNPVLVIAAAIVALLGIGAIFLRVIIGWTWPLFR